MTVKGEHDRCSIRPILGRDINERLANNAVNGPLPMNECFGGAGGAGGQTDDESQQDQAKNQRREFLELVDECIKQFGGIPLPFL